MDRYETIIHIISTGEGMLDAGEKAGELIDLSRMEDDMVISCEEARPYAAQKEPQLEAVS